MNPFWHASLTRFDFDIRLSSLLSIAEQLFDQIHERVIEPHDAGAEQEAQVAAKIGQEIGKVVGVVLGDNSIDLKNCLNIAQNQGLQNPSVGPVWLSQNWDSLQIWDHGTMGMWVKI